MSDFLFCDASEMEHILMQTQLSFFI